MNPWENFFGASLPGTVCFFEFSTAFSTPLCPRKLSIVTVDSTVGEKTVTQILPSDGSNWLNSKIKITSETSGKATIRISVASGRLNINRLAVSNQ